MKHTFNKHSTTDRKLNRNIRRFTAIKCLQYFYMNEFNISSMKTIYHDNWCLVVGWNSTSYNSMRSRPFPSHCLSVSSLHAVMITDPQNKCPLSLSQTDTRALCPCCVTRSLFARAKSKHGKWKLPHLTGLSTDTDSKATNQKQNKPKEKKLQDMDDTIKSM